MLEKYENSPTSGELGDAITETPEAMQEAGQLSFMKVAGLAGPTATEAVAEPPVDQTA